MNKTNKPTMKHVRLNAKVTIRQQWADDPLEHRGEFDATVDLFTQVYLIGSWWHGTMELIATAEQLGWTRENGMSGLLSESFEIRFENGLRGIAEPVASELKVGGVGGASDHTLYAFRGISQL